MQSVRVIPIFYSYFFCFCVAEPPRINSHPQDLKDAIQGELVMFTVVVNGTQPLNYQWEWKSAIDDGGWQSCNVERFPKWCAGATLTIPSVQKSNEGSYRCVISNCAGSQTSNPAELSVGKNANCKNIITASSSCAT